MLQTLDGKAITTVAHPDEFQNALTHLGQERAAAVRRELDRIVNELPPDPGTGRRSFSSSYLGSKLTPWPYPLKHLYDLARELEGATADEERVEGRAGLVFGQFIWECVRDRPEVWVFYDPNLDPRYPDREITGKVYFERG